MSMLCNSTDEPVECPLCMEPLEMDDLSFFPCTCGYQICRFCWHRIRTDENGLCPACRKAYPENPADFKPLSTEELARIKAEKRQKDQQKKQKVTESRKHLANVRVVQKNLVFVVGLSSKLADPEVLKRHEYFGKFGKIHKVVINHSTQYAGNQGPSASAYVTYVRGEDALRAIQAVNNITVEGKTIRASLGTTKYCSHFMKNQSCPKPDCMYLHEIGDDAASFTKEEMQQGRHTDYERSLHEQLLYLVPLNKENRKPSSSPPLTQNLPTLPSNSPPGNGSREAWPTLCTSVPGSSSSSSTSGSTTSLNVPSNLSGKGTSKVEPKEKSRHKKSEDKLRKIKEKGGATPAQPASSTTTTLPNSGTRPRSSSGSPPSDSASSSNHSSPPPPLDNGYSLSSPTSLSLAAEEEEVDRLRDAAETRSTSKGSQPSEVSTGTSEAEEGDYRKFFNSNASTDQDTWQGGESSTSGSQTWRSSANPDTDEPPSSQKDTTDNSFFKNGDDDLGFDPFHETQKALAEMLEKEKSSASSNHATHNSTNSYSFASPPNPPPSSHMFFNSLHQHALSGANQGQQQQQHQQQQAPQLFGQPRPGLYDPSSLASGTSSLSLGIGSSMMPPSVVQRNRVPPPGFNPPAHNTGLGFSGLSRPMSQSDLGSSKILPFISSANQPQASNFTSSMENSLPGRFFAENSGLGGASLGLGLTHLGLLGQTANRHANHNPLSSYGGTLGSGAGLNYSSNNSGYGLGHEAKNEMGTGHKDWQDSLHSLFPNSNFGNVSGGANLRHPNNLCNPQLQTQNAPNKTEWRNSFTDWTALDPAIVSSGHPTDSRSDSPPHWLRYLEQLTESNSSFDSYNASSVAPRQQPPQQQPPQRQPTHPLSYQDLGFGQNNSSCALPPAFSRLEALNSLSNAWPPQVGLHAGLATATPTPPPGFSHLRPGKAAEAQKLLDNM